MPDRQAADGPTRAVDGLPRKDFDELTGARLAERVAAALVVRLPPRPPARRRGVRSAL
jgi:hypothetical protein